MTQLRILASQARVLALALMASMVLSACTAFHPPSPYLPNKAGLVRGEEIVVEANENVYTIAREHNVSMRELIVVNDLKPPFDLRQGQRLYLPEGGTNFGADVKPPASAPLDAVEKTALPPITPPSVSSQPLEAPVQQQAATMAPQPLVQPQPIIRDQVQALNSPVPPPAQAATTVASAQASAPAPAPAPAAMASALSGVSMIWPVQGPILSSFGSKGAGLNNDGINISAPKGAPVVAAAAGTVVYSGNEMKGFGNLVLIRHADDWVTAYAHLDRVLVKKDSIVAQGDMIGTVGKTGNVSSPQLHFEARLEEKPVDPAKVIKRTP